MFIDSQILKESRVYTVTELDPILFLLPSLMNHQEAEATPGNSENQQCRTFAQIFDSLNVELDEEDEILAALDDSPKSCQKVGDNGTDSQTFGDMLKSSACLERALCRICETQISTDPTNGKQVKLYRFDI